jgi:thiol-disulfide isomerase/thioredoxin
MTLAQAISGPLPCIVMFSASWCGPCKVFLREGGEMDRLRRDFAGKVNFIVMKADDPDGEAACEKYRVTSFPTFIGFQKGEQVERVNGRGTYGILSDLAKEMA